MSNFLDIDENILTRNLLVTNGNGADTGTDEVLKSAFQSHIVTPSERQEQSQCKFIIPQPGFCVKTKETTTNEKVFLNFCKSDDVMEPTIDYSDIRLAEILSEGTDDEVDTIRIPMSIDQDKHVETDKSGIASTVVDIIVNAKFMDTKVKTSEIFKLFLINVAMEGVEEKHKLTLDKNGFVILANRKSMGKLHPQFVRNKPSIQDVTTMNNSGDNELKRSSCTNETNRNSKIKRLVEEVCTNENQLEYSIIQTGEETAKAKITIPKLRNTNELKVSLGADRIVVETPLGSLDVFLPLDIHQEECRAEYNVETNILSLELPLVVKP